MGSGGGSGLQGMTLDQVKDLCVGPEGSLVTMTIRRAGQADTAVAMVRGAATESEWSRMVHVDGNNARTRRE